MCDAEINIHAPMLDAVRAPEVEHSRFHEKLRAYRLCLGDTADCPSLQRYLSPLLLMHVPPTTRSHYLNPVLVISRINIGYDLRRTSCPSCAPRLQYEVCNLVAGVVRMSHGKLDMPTIACVLLRVGQRRLLRLRGTCTYGDSDCSQFSVA